MAPELTQMAEIELVDMSEADVETTSEENLEKVIAVDRMRVVSAVLHFNEQDPRARWLRDWLRRQLVLVGRAEHEALKLLTDCLHLEKDTDGKIIRAELLIPAASAEDETAARALLRPDRPRKEKPKKDRKPSARELAAPKFPNGYCLTAVEPQAKGPVRLRFVLLATYPYIADRGRREGQTLTGVIKADPKFVLQRIVTRWLRPPLFDELPPILKNGAAQEIVQAVASHLGLKDEGSQKAVGRPSVTEVDPKEVRKHKEHRLKIQPALFVNSGDTAVYVRKWTGAGRSRVGLYVALPLAPEKETFGLPTAEGHKDVKTNPFRWWRDCLDQFTVLPAWPDKRLKRRSNVSLIPLHCKGGLRRLRRRVDDWESRELRAFVRALSGKNEICWSRLVYRDGEFILQITVKRPVQLVSRPNILGIHITQIQVESNFHTCIFWALLRPVTGSTSDSGLIEVDSLPFGFPRRFWPDQEERRRLAYSAARRIVCLADERNADLFVEEVVGVKKRGRGQGFRNRLGTSFNFSDLARFIADKALDHSRPVKVWRVSGFKVLEQKKQGDSPRHLADLVASEGQQIRERFLARS